MKPYKHLLCESHAGSVYIWAELTDITNIAENCKHWWSVYKSSKSEAKKIKTMGSGNNFCCQRTTLMNKWRTALFSLEVLLFEILLPYFLPLCIFKFGEVHLKSKPLKSIKIQFAIKYLKLLFWCFSDFYITINFIRALHHRSDKAREKWP